MRVLIALVVGLAAGAHVATWGMYKDSAYEGFCPRKYVRSILVAGLVAVVLQSLVGFDLGRAPGVVLLFGMTYAAERFLLEYHKSFFRQEDQSKYFIPMAFHIGGRVVERPGVRRLASLAYLGLVAGAVATIHALDRTGPPATLLTLVLVGSAGGWGSALGGAWKDAPLEGFSPLKFLRSPLLAAAFALLLGTMSQSRLVVATAALGYTVAAIETYKKFTQTHEPPGKFAGKPLRYPEMLWKRHRFVPLYAGIWALVLGALATALVQTAPDSFGAILEATRE